jgi:hypothetical protein
MPGAGFYAIQSSKIRFGRDGVWYADDQPIENKRIARLFSRHVRRRAEGGYELVVGPERAAIEVDDTPYVVVSVSEAPPLLLLGLNDGTWEPLDPASLEIGAGNVLYCSVKRATERARFLRPAYYQIAPYVGETASGSFALRVGGTEYAIRHA